MKITIKINSYLQQYVDGQEEISREIEPGSTIKNILDSFEFPEGTKFLTLINGVHQLLGYVLNDGDVLAVFPPLGGG